MKLHKAVRSIQKIGMILTKFNNEHRKCYSHKTLTVSFLKSYIWINSTNHRSIMDFKLISLVLFFLYSPITCNDQQVDLERPIFSPNIILKDLMSLLKYNQQYLKLSEEYNAYDEKKQNISKEVFLTS
jgi:hypothetical protein